MVCANCGQDIPPGANFCIRCGVPATPQHGAERDAGEVQAKFNKAAPKPTDLWSQAKEIWSKAKDTWWEGKPVGWRWGLGFVGALVVVLLFVNLASDSEQPEVRQPELESKSTPERPKDVPRRVTPARPAPKPKKQVEDKPTLGGWKQQTEVSPLDDSKTIYLDLEAEQPVFGWPNMSFKPILTLACKDKKLQAYVLVGIVVEHSPRTRTASAQVRFDRAELQTLRMVRSLDDQALYFQEPSRIVSTMIEHDQMAFGFTPVDSELAVTTFNLQGLEEAIEPLQEECAWE